MNDQHQVHGKCEVSYWIEAEFSHKGILMRRLRCPFELLMPTGPITFVLSAIPGHCDFAAKPQAKSLVRNGWPLKSKSRLTPRLAIHVGEQWIALSSTMHQTVAIPLTLSMRLSLLFGDGLSVENMLQYGIQGCTVDAKWYKKQTFGNSGLPASTNLSDPTLGVNITRLTVANQKTTLDFPPLYQEETWDSQSKDSTIPRLTRFSASTMLELLLPDTISAPSICTNLLTVNYELELLMSFQQRCSQASILPWTANMKIPLIVKMT